MEPVTGRGWLRHARALRRSGRETEAIAAIRLAWQRQRLEANDERRILDSFGAYLQPEDHRARLDDRVGKRDWAAVRRQLPRVPEDARRLAEALMILALRAPGADAAVRRVPASLVDTPALRLARSVWRRKSGREGASRDILVPVPSDLPEPDRWWREIRRHIRLLLHAREFEEAYRMAGSYPAFQGESRRAGAWYAGWIALEFLRLAPEIAERHLAAAAEASWHPVDISLAAWWRSRAALRAGNPEQARAHLEDAARWPATFFGQLALQELGRPLALADPPASDPAIRARLGDDVRVRALLALGQADGGDFASPFLEALLKETTDAGQAVALNDLLLQAGLPRQAIRVARRAAHLGNDLSALMFPLPSGELFPRAAVDPALPPTVALAVANQESGFDRRAVSSAGARGLMQLMRGTAREEAGKLGLPWQLDRLLADPAYNVRIGSSYLRRRVAGFEGSLPLAVAAYNGGQGNVRKWMRRHGDPRGDRDRMINWILLIPLPETRSYVQRVLERVSAYEALLTESPPPPLRSLGS